MRAIGLIELEFFGDSSEYVQYGFDIPDGVDVADFGYEEVFRVAEAIERDGVRLAGESYYVDGTRIIVIAAAPLVRNMRGAYGEGCLLDFTIGYGDPEEDDEDPEELD